MISIQTLVQLYHLIQSSIPPIALLTPNLCISTPCYQSPNQQSWVQLQKVGVAIPTAQNKKQALASYYHGMQLDATNYNPPNSSKQSGEGVADNNLRLYSYWKSSCSFRNLKGIKFEYKAVNLLKGVHSDPEFLKLNPLGFVPILVDGDAVIADSFAIVMYLEDKHPQQHRLLLHDTHKRAINFQVAHIVSSAIQPFHGLSLLKYIEEKVSPEEKHCCAKNAIEKGFTALERLLKEHAGRYATGDEVLMADLFLAPQLHAAFTTFDIDMKEFPILAGLHEAYKEIPAFREALPENQPDAISQYFGSGR